MCVAGVRMGMGGGGVGVGGYVFRALSSVLLASASLELSPGLDSRLE